MKDNKRRCLCGSGRSYKDCCQPLHQGHLAQDALALMRSRYTAYALNLVDYIILTTHPSNVEYNQDRSSWKSGILEFSNATEFQKLEILDFQEINTEKATVTFIAYLLQSKQVVLLKEKSTFLKVKRLWLYEGAEFLS